MRKVLVAATGVVAAGAVAVGPAIGQGVPTSMSGKAQVSPSKAGTKKKPQGVKLKVDVKWDTPGDGDKPVVQKADVLFPKGSLYNGGKYPKCSEAVLNRGGPSACPKGAIMGTGSGNAFADEVITKPKITVVNGGASKVYLYTVMTNPARVQAPVPGTITKMSGKWAYKLHLEVPRNLQIVAGVPIALRDLTVSAGRKDWLATTSCPSTKKWEFEIETFLSTGGSSKFASSVACS
jgi:hypothetical protein